MTTIDDVRERSEELIATMTAFIAEQPADRPLLKGASSEAEWRQFADTAQRLPESDQAPKNRHTVSFYVDRGITKKLEAAYHQLNALGISISRVDFREQILLQGLTQLDWIGAKYAASNGLKRSDDANEAT